MVFVNTNKKRGFTLIELLVVISIIATLSAVVITSLASARTKAKEARVKTEVHEIQAALEEYNVDNGGYPNPNNDSSPTLYCIGANDCQLAGQSVGTELPQSIAKGISNLAAVFPNFTNNTTVFDQNNKGYVYLSCGSGLSTCEANTATLIYPIFNGSTITMVNAEVGSFKVVSNYTASSNSDNNNSNNQCGTGGTDDCANYSNATGACNYDTNGTGSSNGTCTCGGGTDNCANYCTDNSSDICNHDNNGTGSCAYGCGVSLGSYFNAYCDMSSTCTNSNGSQGSGYYCQSDGTYYDSGSYSFSTTNNGNCSCGNGNSGRGYYCSNQTYYDQSTYPYYSSYDTEHNCSYGNGWAGSGYFYCTGTQSYSCTGTINITCSNYYYDYSSCNNYTYGTCSWGGGSTGGCGGTSNKSCADYDQSTCNNISGCNFNYDSNVCEGSLSINCSSYWDQNSCESNGCSYSQMTSSYCYSNGNNSSCGQFGDSSSCSYVSGCSWTSN